MTIEEELRRHQAQIDSDNRSIDLLLQDRAELKLDIACDEHCMGALTHRNQALRDEYSERILGMIEEMVAIELEIEDLGTRIEESQRAIEDIEWRMVSCRVKS